MKILLTGGAGFIGSHFAKHALRYGHTVINIDKLTYAGNLANLEEYQKNKHHVFYQEDICDFSKMRSIFEVEQPDAVVHMAAESHVDRSIDSGDVFVQTNIVGTYQLLKVAQAYYESIDPIRKSSFRFLHLSTDEVYGSLLPNEEKFNEKTPYRPNSPYSAAKASSDLFVRAYHHTYKLPTIIVNSSNNYGPFQYPEKLIPVVILNAIERKPIPVYGDGQQIRDWLYVEDHVDAILSLLQKGIVGETYCIGGENEWTNLAIIQKICSILYNISPSSKGSYQNLITFVQDRPGHDRRYAIDASKIKKELQWSPQHSFEAGLEKTIRWYVDHVELLTSLFDRRRLGLNRVV